MPRPTLPPPARAPRRSRLLLAALLGLLLAGVAPAQVGELDTSERTRLEGEIDRYRQLRQESQARLEALGAELAGTDAAIRERAAEQQRVLADLDALRSERDTLLEERARLEGERDATEASIVEAEADLADLRRRIQALLLGRYRQRGVGLARMLSQSESFHDLRVKNHYLSLLARRDVSLVNELDDALASLESLRLALEGQLADLEEKRAELDRNEAELTEREGRLTAVIAELQTTRDGQTALRREALESQATIEGRLDDLDGALREEIDRLQARQEELERQQVEAFLESERARLRREAEANQDRIDTLTGPLPSVGPEGFVLPLAEARVLTRFGEREERAVTLRADARNAAVFSMAPGRVVEVNLLGANEGYLVAIEHSPGVVMIYSNLHKPALSVGDRVVEGQVIGYLGGGSLLGSDVLKLRARVTKDGAAAYVDPGRWLGF